MRSYNQQQALEAIKETLAERASTFGPDDWTAPELMAFCEIESSFNPRAYRPEPRIADASYGLMQTLVRTARSVGFAGAETALFTPKTSIYYGCKYLDDVYLYLNDHLGREPEMTEIVASYNAGPGAVVSHVRRNGEGTTPVPAYVNKWFSAYNKWCKALDAAPDDNS